jgi:uncharacterized protein (DUF3084 family)
MNTQDFNIQQDNHFNSEPNKVWDGRKIREVEEEIELLREQIESLKREQQNGYDLTHACLQELEDTNKEVELMNQEILNLINSQRLPIEQAKQWAKSIIKNNVPISESLSEILSAIYGYPVNLNESESIKSSRFKREDDNFKVQSCEIRAKSEQTIDRSRKITARSREITARSQEIKARSYEISNQLGSEKVSHTGSKVVNLSGASNPLLIARSIKP